MIEAGRVTGRGMRTFHYYGPDVEEIHGIVGDVMALHAEYKYRPFRQRTRVGRFIRRISIPMTTSLRSPTI